MGFMDKMKNVIGLGEDDYDEDDILTDDYDREEEEPRSFGRKNKVVNIHATTQLKVVVMQPENFEDARGIADHLKTKKPVIINLEGLETDVALPRCRLFERCCLRTGRKYSKGFGGNFPYCSVQCKHYGRL